jgi:hypothetical protein
MKLLISICLLTSPFLFQQKPSEAFDCVVVEMVGGESTTVCDSRSYALECANRSDPHCLNATLDIPLENWPREWGKAEKGSVVRAEWVDGHLRPVDCTPEPRTGDYKRVDLNGGGAIARREKESKCNGPTSAFIRDLLEKIKTQ